MNNPFSLENKLIVVTGASSGIGRQCAVTCAAAGARVILIARNEERLRETLSMMEGNGHGYYSFDIGQAVIGGGSISLIINEIVKTYGKVDGFLHAAGIERTLPVKLLTPDDYLEVFRTNTLSAFEFIHQFSYKKYFNDGGHIVLISSITSVIGRGGVAAYAASKGALNSAIRPMALEFAKRRVTVNCVSPGTVLTPMMETFLSTLSDDDRARRIAGFPLGLGTPNDVASLCLFLLSDASRWITGQNIIIDGGYTSQ